MIREMRKILKSAVYEELSIIYSQELINTDCFVIDGCYLSAIYRTAIYPVCSNKEKTESLTYLDICNTYINYFQQSFKTERKVVVFDGYNDQSSIKENEHQRRNKCFCPEIQITASSTIYANQESFLANS